MKIEQQEFDSAFDAVKSYVDGSFEEAEKWMRDLEKRIADLEQNQFEDAGVWVDSRSYRKNQGVTQAGSFWIAQRDVAAGEKPGASNNWRLAVKAGKDAR